MHSVIVRMCTCVFFFSSRRRHTRCSRDWSSDVCSSDLLSRSANVLAPGDTRRTGQAHLRHHLTTKRTLVQMLGDPFPAEGTLPHFHGLEIGRASCRERV